MKRRDFLKAGATGTAAVAASTLAAPAIAQDVRQWRMVTAWPKEPAGSGRRRPDAGRPHHRTLRRPHRGQALCRRRNRAGQRVFDAVGQGTAELYHAVPAYWGSKSKGILLFGSQPFGLTAPNRPAG